MTNTYMTHDLKTWPEFYVAIVEGTKRFEVRRNDRRFAVGDTLNLQEWDPVTKAYLGREARRTVTSILRGPKFGVKKGFCVMSIGEPDDTSPLTPLPDRGGEGDQMGAGKC